jgi:REP element-mobilizing transposase RayT
MSKLLRYYSPGQTYFVTSVTANREPILVTHADLFHMAMDRLIALEELLIDA